jgi:hypothetical protein
MKYQRKKVQKGGNVFKKIGRRVRKTAKKVGRTARRVGKTIKKNEVLRRGVMAARRAADFGLKQVPVVGNVYALGDLGVRGVRAARKGKLKKFLATEGVKGLATTIAPQLMAAKEAKDASQGVLRAVVDGKGKGKSRRHKGKMMIVARRVR